MSLNFICFHYLYTSREGHKTQLKDLTLYFIETSQQHSLTTSHNTSKVCKYLLLAKALYHLEKELALITTLSQNGLANSDPSLKLPQFNTQLA